MSNSVAQMVILSRKQQSIRIVATHQQSDSRREALYPEPAGTFEVLVYKEPIALDGSFSGLALLCGLEDYLHSIRSRSQA
jgi:hypothetical protein